MKSESIFGIDVAYTASWKDCALCSMNREIGFVWEQRSLTNWGVP